VSRIGEDEDEDEEDEEREEESGESRRNCVAYLVPGFGRLANRREGTFSDVG
jgi:hypothetical protein